LFITVGIGSRLLTSDDEGRSWNEGSRTLPPRTDPKIYGLRDPLKIQIPPGWSLTEAHVAADGIGLAAGFEPVPRDESGCDSIARFWRTRDGGATWQSIHPTIGFWSRLRAFGGWPPQEVDSIAVQPGGLMAFAWEDPWLHDGPNNHIVFSTDGGDRWRYGRLDHWLTELARGPGPLRVLGAKSAVRFGGALRGEKSELDWSRPATHWREGIPLRSARFISDTDAYAIVVSFPRDENPPRPREQMPPPLVGLAQSRDGGRRWTMVKTWEGPRNIDINERHVITLDVN
jgi:hypothetical protein